MIRSTGTYKAYDFGFFGNFLKYGRPSPPDYALSKVTAPVAAFYSDNDWLAPPKVTTPQPLAKPLT